MTFEEEFPSLKDKQVDSIYYGREGYPEYQQQGDCLKIVDVEDYCLDKAIVEKARDLLRQNLLDSKDGIDCDVAFQTFNKELGL